MTNRIFFTILICFLWINWNFADYRLTNYEENVLEKCQEMKIEFEQIQKQLENIVISIFVRQPFETLPKEGMKKKRPKINTCPDEPEFAKGLKKECVAKMPGFDHKRPKK